MSNQIIDRWLTKAYRINGNRYAIQHRVTFNYYYLMVERENYQRGKMVKSWRWVEKFTTEEEAIEKLQMMINNERA